ncbi:MAG: hypothetical protein ACREHG_03965 [Candidatus Saccharimonadales bacterium]
MCSKFTLGADVWPGLVKVQEEASEVVTAAAKVISHVKGPEATEKRGHLEDEMGDLIAALDALMVLNPRLDMDRIHERAAAKTRVYLDRHEKRQAKRNGKVTA